MTFSSVRVQPLSVETARPIADTHSSTRYAAALLLLVCGHHWLLCALQSVGIHATPGVVAATEFLIYLGCVPLIYRRLSPRIVTALLLVFGLLILLAIARGGLLDIKAMRDLLIPALFLWAGRSWRGSTADLDRIVRVIVIVVIAVGLTEALFFDIYTRFINTFTYYIGIGGIAEANAQIAGQTVTLNGLRPEGIGRTLLPQLLGAHRVSSLFLEPVSLGNFAVIIFGLGPGKTGLGVARGHLVHPRRADDGHTG